MVKCLRDAMLYSEKRARDLLFWAVEQLSYGRPMILARMTREVIARARDAGERSGYQFANWEPAGKAVMNAMLGAGALLGTNELPVSRGIGAQASLIAGLHPEFRDLTEAYLIEYLVRSLGDITVRDHRALAHALFRQFDPSISMGDFEDRVVILMAMLSDRVILRDDVLYATQDIAAPLAAATTA